jgi:hypothetical protein
MFDFPESRKGFYYVLLTKVYVGSNVVDVVTNWDLTVYAFKFDVIKLFKAADLKLNII